MWLVILRPRTSLRDEADQTRHSKGKLKGKSRETHARHGQVDWDTGLGWAFMH